MIDASQFKACLFCTFWVQHLGAMVEDYGACRRYAPKPRTVVSEEKYEESGFTTFWPETFREEWCGEFDLDVKRLNKDVDAEIIKALDEATKD